MKFSRNDAHSMHKSSHVRITLNACVSIFRTNGKNFNYSRARVYLLIIRRKKKALMFCIYFSKIIWLKANLDQNAVMILYNSVPGRNGRKFSGQGYYFEYIAYYPKCKMSYKLIFLVSDKRRRKNY